MARLMIGLVVCSISLANSQSASAQAFKSRNYTFEEGSVGVVGGSGVIDHESANGVATVADANRAWYDIKYIVGTSSQSDFGCCLLDSVQSWLGQVQSDAPPLTQLAGLRPSFVDVTGDSPAAQSTSTRALSFDGGFGRSLTDEDGMRGVILDADAVAANETLNDANPFASFSYLSQAWLKPEDKGSRQVVWSIGSEQGAVGISSGGKWQFRQLGPIANIETDVDVKFDEWQHVAVFRSGSSATMYLDGQVIAQGTNFFNLWADEIFLGADTQLQRNYKGLIDDFSVSGFPNGQGVNPLTDLDFFAGFPQDPVLGDVDLDDDVDQDDYDLWSANVGFDNGFGAGDPITLTIGDVDQNGRVDLRDFNIIQREARLMGNIISFAAVPEPGSCCLLLSAVALACGARRRVRDSQLRHESQSTDSRHAGRTLLVAFVALLSVFLTKTVNAELVVAEDFKYKQTTKSELNGNTFTLGSFAGGQNGTAGFFDSEWDSFGASVILSEDFSAGAMITPFSDDLETAMTEQFFGGAGNAVFRDYDLAPSVAPNQTLYFAAKVKFEEEGTYEAIPGDPNPDPAVREGEVSARVSILSNTAVGVEDSVVSFGLVGPAGNGLTAEVFADLGGTVSQGNSGAIAVAQYHTIVGKLEINAAGSSSNTADFDGNGLVNGGDFLIWQRNNGRTDSPSVSEGNFNGDENVDAADLEGWQQQYGGNGVSTPDERLTVWLNPTGVETSNDSVLMVESDIISGLNDPDVFTNLVVISGPDPGGAPKRPHYYDDVAIGTTWDDVATVDVPRLTLEVNTTSGQVQIVNNTSETFDISAYEIISDSGSLDPNASLGSGWDSLAQQGESGWVENNPTTELLTESNFVENSTKTINPTDVVSLGAAFNTGGSQDIVGRWQVLEGNDSLLNLFEVEYVTSSSIVSVPEPSAAIILAIAVALSAGFRRVPIDIGSHF